MRRPMVVLSVTLLAVLCVSVNVAFGKKPSSEPGQQTMTARWTDTPAVIDGVIGPGEYSAANPVRVNFNQPTTTPGIAALDDYSTPYSKIHNLPPDNPADLSYTIYVMYDDEDLYIAVDVVDDIVINDGPTWTWKGEAVEAPFFDDCVTLYIDGDEVGNDLYPWGAPNPGKEGFQLIMDVGGDALTFAEGGFIYSSPLTPGFWEAAPGPRLRGYVVEFRISLSSIDVIDGEEEASPGPGSSVGFNVQIDDDDNGGYPYNWYLYGEDWGPDPNPIDTLGAWDGDYSNYWFSREDDWGTLYFAPHPKGKAMKPALSLQPSSWGQVKSLFR